ncbi:MAG: Tim44 domain-containing protein [Myxococcales bacterium]|nr:Tim44 domain-containing protein [Myxococcales bacterium]
MARSKRSRRVAVAVGGALLFAAAVALARPGGGHTFSGGSHGGGGDGGGGGGALVELLIWLVIEHPSIGIPVVLVVIVVAIVRKVAGSKLQGWATTTTPAQVAAVPTIQHSATVPRSQLDRIRSADPGFSVVLFEDFAYLLYAALQRSRATGTASIAAYLSPGLAHKLPDPALGDVRGIVIGAMKTVHFSGLGGATLAVELQIEANYVEAPRAGGERRYYVVDRMRLERASSAKSRPFARARTLDCPNCGAPLEAVRGTQCSYCGQDVGYGRFDWMVARFDTLTREPRGPLLTENVPEQGTELPTIADPRAQPRFAQIQQRDPALTWDALQARIAYVFDELQAAWSGRDTARIRPFVSDNLFQSMVYWIDLYVQQRCRNVTENARILRIDLANVLSDAHYDAVTVRVFATGLDYTISDDGKVLSGSRSRARTYSEYWTLIRGSSRKGAAKGNANCPGCGAPLEIGMAGNCKYCQVKVTSGEFDWVLSRIEQDEAYSG